MARRQTPPHLRREYECVYLVRQDLEDPQVSQVIEKFRNLVAGQGGKVTRLDNWGKRRLAYEIQKQPKATYVYMQFLGTSGLVGELERNMRLDDNVVRWLTVLIDEAVDPTARPEATEVTRRELAEEEEAQGDRSAPPAPKQAAPAEEAPKQASESTGETTATGEASDAPAASDEPAPTDAPAGTGNDEQEG